MPCTPSPDVIPDSVAHDDAILVVRAKTFPARQEEVWLRLATQPSFSFHYNNVRFDTNGLQRGIDERSVAGGGNGAGDARLAQDAERLDEPLGNGRGCGMICWKRLFMSPVDGLHLFH